MSSEELSDCRCAFCGIDLDDNAPAHMSLETMQSFCSLECLENERNGKRNFQSLVNEDKKNGENGENDEETQMLQVRARGKYNGEVIDGLASFHLSGTVMLDFKHPQFKASFDVPKTFLQVVKAIYQDSEDEHQDSENKWEQVKM